MIQYLADDIRCRELYIRQYFDEQTDEPCGKCDLCVSRKAQHLKRPEGLYEILRDKDGITVKDLLAQYSAAQQVSVKRELRQLADEDKIRIVEDKIYKRS